ncbi:MAG: hypothetical protein A2Y63_01660 [Candidatus Riflebacteria bacterium RBG_13_59_9]|nr:MAG: hypothetical protein A2Y63_01660 [Candidatus Riflebacteria bacterium RBG_13_59_9]
MEHPMKDPLFRGNPVSYFFAFLSIVALASALWQFALLHWLNGVLGIVLSVIFSYIGYRAAGGARNPGILRSVWKDKGVQEIVGIPGFNWETKVNALFEHLEEEANGDIQQAALMLGINEPPPEVATAHQLMKENSTPENWSNLRQTVIKNPPKGHK